MIKFYNKLLLAVCTVLVLFIAKESFAATIDAADCPGQSRCVIFWEQINSDDVTSTERWRGGSGLIIMTGTLDGAVFDLQFTHINGGTATDVYNSEAPTGTRYNATSTLDVMTCFTLPAGYLKYDLSTAGTGSQDIDIYIVPTDKCE